MENMQMLFSLLNQFIFNQAKQNIENIEYYFDTNPNTSGNPLVKEILHAIRNYNLDAIGQPLFDSILAKCAKTPQESKQIMDEILRWKSYTKEQVQPAADYLNNICAAAIIRKAGQFYNQSPAEYLKYLKNVDYVSTNVDIFGSTGFSKIDINTIIAESADSYIPSRYDWINQSFDPNPGYPRGMMAIVCAAPGTGKSLWLMSEALFFATHGYKTLYVALGDLNMKDFIVRTGAMFSGLSFADTQRQLGEIYNSMCQIMNDNLEISINAVGKVSADEIVEFVKSRGAFYDVVIIDYDSNSKGVGEGDSMYNEFGKLYETINELVLLGKLVFVASQPKITAWQNSVLEMSDIGESSRKQHTADMIIGIGREERCPNHLHTIKISKNRRGEEGAKAYTIRLNNGRWKEIPKGLYDQLKTDTEKHMYTEFEIDSMIGQQNAQENRIRADVEAKRKQQQNQIGFNPFINP